MCLDFRQRIVMVCAAAFALTALARPAAAQPKLESSSLGHWRGYWISTMDPRMQGPVEQFIDTERTRRVFGTMKWTTAGGLMVLDLAGTTSASCRFNDVLTGMGESEGIRMVINGMHEVGVATGEYMLFRARSCASTSTAGSMAKDMRSWSVWVLRASFSSRRISARHGTAERRSPATT